MSWTSITKPTQGATTKKSLIDAIIDDLEWLKNSGSGGTVDVTGNGIGSFETDTNADGVPDGWSKTLYTGGSFTMDSSDQRHGQYSAKFTSSGGASNGGGYLETTDFFPVSVLRNYEVCWEMKSSTAGVSNKVEITWYTAAQSTISTTSVYSSTSNPTSWTAFNKLVTPPSTACWAKFRVIGCHTASTTAGSTWFDNLLMRIEDCPIPSTQSVFTSTGTFTVPSGIRRIRVKAWGAGGGGGGDAASPGKGGGAGAYAEKIFDVVPGASYSVTIGTGGAGGTNSPTAGSNGGDTTFDTLTAGGGVGGGTIAGVAGTGGSASGGSVSFSGQSGHGTAGGNAPMGGGWGGQ